MDGLAKSDSDKEVFNPADDEDVESSATPSVLSTSLKADVVEPESLKQVPDASSILKHVDSDLDNQENGTTTLPGRSSSTSTSSRGTRLPTKSSCETFTSRFLGYHHDSLVFALRISVAVTAASMFLLAFPPDDPWPQASWIYVTVCIVAWQPQIDTASVLRKTIKRTFGTMVGSILGMVVGFISLEFATTRGQAIFMGFAIATQGFLYPYICDRFGFRESYVAFLGNVTFGIVLFGFFESRSDRAWLIGVYRVVNILIGCAIVALCAVIVWPISTKDTLVEAINEHMKVAGQTSGIVLESAAAVCSGEIKPPTIGEVITHKNMHDAAHRTYIKNIDGWKKCRELFPMLQYDPCFRKLSEEDQSRFSNHMVKRLARSFRIELNLILLDAMIRTEMKFEAPHESLDIIRDVGHKAKLILDLSVDQAERDAATKDLLEKDLVGLRVYLSQMTEEGTTHFKKVDIKSLQRIISNSATVLPLSPVDTEGEQTILFFLLVEHLILRVARLHYYCLEYSEPPDQSCCSLKGK